MKYLLNITRFIFVFVLFGFFSAGISYAQESQSLSVTPPLFQLSILPGDIWQSSIKVVNVNPYPLTIYTEVVNFSAMGENGQGRFLPLINETQDKATLAEWIEIPKGPYTIPAEQSTELTFFVEVPKDASPGGHYAAILITTDAPSTNDGKQIVQTSQTVTSLFFVRIEGDVEELGTIREFRAIDSFLPTPEAEFSLRFENKGNVHLQPRGDIVITNMWGTERGIIPINYQTHFGNVLPQSIRDFTFAWKSEFNITDIGRYKAVATLAYGQDGIKSVTSTTYFWVIPIKSTLITLAVLMAFIAVIVWMIKAYVRKMLTLAGVDVETLRDDESAHEENHQEEVVVKASKRGVRAAAPIEHGVLDLRKRLSSVEESVDVIKTIIHFVVSYKVFFISILVLVGIFVSAVIYIGRATEENQDYEVIIDENGSEMILKGEEIKN